MKFMQDNKHYQAAMIDGFWSFVTRDPGDYEGKHRLFSKGHPEQIWIECRACRDMLGMER